MEKITRQTLADGVLSRWNGAYASGQYGSDKIAIGKLLAGLPLPIDPDEVDRIIGNGSWTRIKCNNCNKDDVAAVIQLGEEPDYESSTALVCESCLEQALRLIK